MSSGIVLPLNRFRPTTSAPLFVFIDLQKEFVLEGRPLQIRSAESALANCRRLLHFARAERFPIAHARLSGAAFHRAANGAEWIDEFRPHGSEMVFERVGPSCYSSSMFHRMMDEGGGEAAVIAGLAASTSCLTTLIDARKAGHHAKFVSDASSSNAGLPGHEPSVHEAAVHILEQFVEVVTTDDVIAQLKSRAVVLVEEGESDGRIAP